MRAAGLDPIAVSITGGKRSRQSNGMVYLPKRELVRGLVVAFEGGQLKVAKGLVLADAFMDELQAFREPCFSPALYRDRNAIERMFGRIKDFRRIATRFDRLAQNFLAAVCLVATVCYWI